MKKLFIGCLALLVILSMQSCGKKTETKSDPTIMRYQVNDYEFKRCRVVEARPCGLTLDCGYYGLYFCIRSHLRGE